MPLITLNNFGGLNTQVNPLTLGDGNITQALNVISDPFGAKSKRPGYISFLGAPDGSQITDLFAWYRADGSTFQLYRKSGSILYSSLQGTGAWTTTENGTFTAGSHIGYAFLQDVMIIGDGLGSTRHSSTGTSFTNTTLAPISPFFEQYQDRIYAAGTANTLFYSSIDDATNWNTSGTSDSASINIPGEGKNAFIFKNSDRLNIIKNSRQNIFRWDGANLVDMATNAGPTSPYSFYQHEGIAFYLNRFGIYSYAGSAPNLVSNPIQKLIYNKSGSAMAGTVFSQAIGGGNIYDYLVSVGTTTDDYTGVTISNAILKYDMRLNENSVWSFADKPTAFSNYVDSSGSSQLIFGNTTGQAFQLSGTALTDNGTPIQAVIEFLLFAGTLNPKNWYLIRAMMNPGCEAQIEVAVSDTLTPRTKNYVPLGQATDGVFEARVPSTHARGVFMFVKFSDNSVINPFQLFYLQAQYDIVRRRADG